MKGMKSPRPYQIGYGTAKKAAGGKKEDSSDDENSLSPSYKSAQSSDEPAYVAPPKAASKSRAKKTLSKSPARSRKGAKHRHDSKKSDDSVKSNKSTRSNKKSSRKAHGARKRVSREREELPPKSDQQSKKVGQWQ